jgi:hypothetical protein
MEAPMHSVGGASALVTLTCVLFTLRTQILRSICNFTHTLYVVAANGCYSGVKDAVNGGGGGGGGGGGSGGGGGGGGGTARIAQPNFAHKDGAPTTSRLPIKKEVALASQ